jgi:hypothetical protein
MDGAVVTAQDEEAAVLADLMADLIPSIDFVVVPVTEPVETSALLVSVTPAYQLVYIPTPDAWIRREDTELGLDEVEVPRCYGFEGILALISIDISTHLLDANLVLGRDGSPEAIAFAAAFTQLEFLSETVPADEVADMVDDAIERIKSVLGTLDEQ